MSLHRTRNAVGAVIAIVAIVAGACGPAVTNPSASTIASVPVDPEAVARAMLLAPWRPAPLSLDDNLLSSAVYVCRNSGDPDMVAAMADVPVAVVDARGAGLASIVFANDDGAFECRVKIEMVGEGLGATIIDAPSRLVPDATVPVDDAGIRVVSQTRVDEETGSRTILIGRVGPKAYSVGVNFDDASWITASKSNGWFLIWWPGNRAPIGIAASDNKSIVVASAPSPGAEKEGRVGPAAWWVDPAAAPLTLQSATIRALIRERGCASGQVPRGRVLEPVVATSADAVTVTVWLRRPPGVQDCPANPAFPVEITLPEPLGDRKLLDGSTVPPRDATVPAE